MLTQYSTKKLLQDMTWHIQCCFESTRAHLLLGCRCYVQTKYWSQYSRRICSKSTFRLRFQLFLASMNWVYSEILPDGQWKSILKSKPELLSPLLLRNRRWRPQEEAAMFYKKRSDLDQRLSYVWETSSYSDYVALGSNLDRMQDLHQKAS